MDSLLLIRHAESEHNVRSITGGWTDTELTSSGLKQAELLAERLGHELGGKSTYLVSGDLKRVVQTAQIIAHTLGVTNVTYHQLTDLNNGAAAGKTHAEAREIALPATEPLEDWKPYPHAETLREFFDRITNFMDGFAPPTNTIPIIVTHAATINVIVRWWLKIPFGMRISFDIRPASLSALKINRWGEWTLERLNDCAHLYQSGITTPI